MDDTDMMIVDAIRQGCTTAAQVADAIDLSVRITRRRMTSLVKYGVLERTTIEDCGGFYHKPMHYYTVRGETR